MTLKLPGAAIFLMILGAGPAHGQRLPGEQGSRNVSIISHIPLGGGGGISISNTEIRAADLEIEQELSRPYAYVPMLGWPSQVHFINLKDPKKAQVVYTWHLENPDLHKGLGALSPTYLKTHGRYYFFNGFQWAPNGPNADLGGILWDVTGMPDSSKIKEVKRIRYPEAPGG